MLVYAMYCACTECEAASQRLALSHLLKVRNRARWRSSGCLALTQSQQHSMCSGRAAADSSNCSRPGSPRATEYTTAERSDLTARSWMRYCCQQTTTRPLAQHHFSRCLPDMRDTARQWLSAAAEDTSAHNFRRNVCAPRQVLAFAMLGGRSFTAEDVVEIHTHGGSVAPARVLDALLSAGARLARPGEFTLRAFLNGRLDLTQACPIEHVVDLEVSALYPLPLQVRVVPW